MGGSGRIGERGPSGFGGPLESGNSAIDPFKNAILRSGGVAESAYPNGKGEDGHPRGMRMRWGSDAVGPPRRNLTAPQTVFAGVALPASFGRRHSLSVNGAAGLGAKESVGQDPICLSGPRLFLDGPAGSARGNAAFLGLLGFERWGARNRVGLTGHTYCHSACVR